MAVVTSYLAKPWCTPKIPFPSNSSGNGKIVICDDIVIGKPQTKAKACCVVGASLFQFLSIVEPASSLPLHLQQQLHEPANALSLPTWAVHVSSVLEWVLAMSLVWQYGEKSGYQAWKGLSWGMVPLLGGALCACTWHFFYNSESLEVLVALQAALTVIGNATMCIAAYRIYKSSR
ncbi:hypothetical protein RIF29_36752 [Crotalaria pallida]|uniref:Ycf49-like protein n=1 Tax=Crotalaria pallida TaxID=3830 RepID=A0AAN9HUT7_CROPI